jgi:hypothetical protein
LAGSTAGAGSVFGSTGGGAGTSGVVVSTFGVSGSGAGGAGGATSGTGSPILSSETLDGAQQTGADAQQTPHPAARRALQTFNQRQAIAESTDSKTTTVHTRAAFKNLNNDFRMTAASRNQM